MLSWIFLIQGYRNEIFLCLRTLLRVKQTFSNIRGHTGSSYVTPDISGVEFRGLRQIWRKSNLIFGINCWRGVNGVSVWRTFCQFGVLNLA